MADEEAAAGSVAGGIIEIDNRLAERGKRLGQIEDDSQEEEVVLDDGAENEDEEREEDKEYVYEDGQEEHEQDSERMEEERQSQSSSTSSCYGNAGLRGNKEQDDFDGLKSEAHRENDIENKTDADERQPTSPMSLSSIKLKKYENPLEWPYQLLNLPDDDVIGDEIGCVIRIKKEYFPGNGCPQFRCVINNRLGVDVVGNSEELLSHVVTVQRAQATPGGGPDTPVVVAIPYATTSRTLSTRELAMKTRGTGSEDEWKMVPLLAIDSSFAAHKGPFAEVRTAQLGSFAVVAQLIKDRQTITKKGGTIKSTCDTRVSVYYPPGICSLTSVTLQVHLAEHTVGDLKAHMRHCSDLIAASPIISLSHSTNKPFQQPITVTIPCPPNPLRNPVAGAANDAKPTTSTKPFEKQAPLSADGAVIIRGTKSSIFGGDPAEDTLCLMYRQSSWTYWNEMDNVHLKQILKDLVSFELDKPIDKLLVLRVAANSRYPIKTIAQTFEMALQVRYASIILQHREDDPRRMVVLCVPARQTESTLRRLAQEGYEGIPEPSPEVPLTEGQVITMRFTANIKIVGDDHITFIFHSQRRNPVKFQVEETNKFGNHSSDEYRGMAEFHGTPRIALADMEDPEEVLLREAEAKAAEKVNKHSGGSVLIKSDKKKPEGLDGSGRDYQSQRKTDSDLICKIAVTLPKTEPGPPAPPSRYRATAIDVKGCVSNANLRWLATELGNEWESLANMLGIKRSRMQSIKRNNPSQVEHQVFDMLVTWRSMLPRAYDKERKLCRALVRCGRYDLVDELKARGGAEVHRTGQTTANSDSNILDLDEY